MKLTPYLGYLDPRCWREPDLSLGLTVSTTTISAIDESYGIKYINIELGLLLVDIGLLLEMEVTR